MPAARMRSYYLFVFVYLLYLLSFVLVCNGVQLDQYFGYWRQPPATYPVVGYPSQWSLQNNGFCSATPQSDFFGNVQTYSHLSDSERRRIAIEQGVLINIPITSKEDHDILPEMIRIPISENEESADANGSQSACEQAENAAIPAIEEDSENPESPPQIDVCFSSAAEIEAQPSEVEVVETVEAVTTQPHQSVNRTGNLVRALKKVHVSAMSQKSGPGNDKNTLVHTAAPKRSRFNKVQPPLAPKLKSAIKIAPSTSTEQVTIRHAWEAALPATPKKERFHVKPKKPQTPQCHSGFWSSEYIG
ncbi:hypothetical protein BASA50_005601 [Batrachochytrium salamandrivorans]|uniref:Uncharacterized protein n=1 Tax=Batrachochytrium salamandrivorans TaxID=1357716 RepID=A0ABQ8FCA1_9FUNG|nr:hypothetical protein BASA50_005601 [Batrachochytrium salamandrivorans]